MFPFIFDEIRSGASVDIKMRTPSGMNYQSVKDRDNSSMDELRYASQRFITIELRKAEVQDCHLQSQSYGILIKMNSK